MCKLPSINCSVGARCWLPLRRAQQWLPRLVLPVVICLAAQAQQWTCWKAYCSRAGAAKQQLQPQAGRWVGVGVLHALHQCLQQALHMVEPSQGGWSPCRLAGVRTSEALCWQRRARSSFRRGCRRRQRRMVRARKRRWVGAVWRLEGLGQGLRPGMLSSSKGRCRRNARRRRQATAAAKQVRQAALFQMFGFIYLAPRYSVYGILRPTRPGRMLCVRNIHVSCQHFAVLSLWPVDGEFFCVQACRCGRPCHLPVATETVS